MNVQHGPRVSIRPLTATDADGCDGVIATLPYHFGNKQGRAECARAVRASEGLVASDAGEVVGFLTVKHHFAESTEITWMAVRADRRAEGIGRALIERLSRDARASGRRILLVNTLSAAYDEGDVEDGYERTRRFYRSAGFVPAMELPNLWPDSPALLLVMPLS